MFTLGLGVDFSKVMPFVDARGRAKLDLAIRWGIGELARETVAKIRQGLEGTSWIGLPQSWRDYPVEGRRYVYSALVASKHVGASFRDTGGTVTPGKTASRGGPKKGQLTAALTIPLADARTALGVSRQGRTASEKGVSAFGPMKPIFFGKGKRIFGKLVSASRRYSKRKKRTILVADPAGSRKEFFLLARSVTVPPSPYIAPAISAMEERRAVVFEEVMRRALDGGTA